MVSNVLIIADALTEAVELTLDALKTIHCNKLQIKALFISRLTGMSLKNLGYNILTLLMRDEQEALQRARTYFTINDIPYDIQIMHISHWETVSKEVEVQRHDILILQGEFANLWRKDHPSNYALGTMTGSVNPVWIIDGGKAPDRVSVQS